MRYLHTLDYWELDELLKQYIPDDSFTSEECEDN